MLIVANNNKITTWVKDGYAVNGGYSVELLKDEPNTFLIEEIGEKKKFKEIIPASRFLSDTLFKDAYKKGDYDIVLNRANQLRDGSNSSHAPNLDHSHRKGMDASPSIVSILGGEPIMNELDESVSWEQYLK